MPTAISTIKREFEQSDKELRQSFRFVVRDTAKGIWGASDLDVVFALFEEINLRQYKHFLDLGCGDGRVVLVASLFTKATGIEFDQDLIAQGNKIKDKLGLTDAELVCDDFYKHELSQYDIIFINPDTGFYNGLEDKLLKEIGLKARLFVYNNIFLPRLLKRGKTHWFNQTPVTEFTQ